MRCTFYGPKTDEEVNFDEWENAVQKLRYDLMLIRQDRCRPDEVVSYAKELAGRAWGFGDLLFLALGEPGTMPSGARVAYVYVPTFLGAEILMVSVLKHPELLQDLVFAVVLRRLLNGCMGRDFRDRECMEILDRADVHEFTERFGFVNREFREAYRNYEAAIHAAAAQRRPRPLRRRQTF
ncbi:MAG: hypothetical protein IJL69_05260 [Oscillospiraceae bacterium]|nr:hypothetical protein [Oscillospiraceae bacterium]